MTGPIHITEGDTDTWTAYASGGSGNYDYAWQMKASSGGIWDNTCYDATTSCTTSFPEDADGQNEDGGIRVLVTDRVYGTTGTGELSVTIGDDDSGGGGGGGGCSAATTNAICYSNATAGAVAAPVPEAFALEDGYPNPSQAGQRVTIPFALPEAAEVTLTVYDMLGREVQRIESGTVAAGRPRAVVGTEDFSSGIYVYRLRAVGTSGETFTGTGKLVVVQ